MLLPITAELDVNLALEPALLEMVLGRVHQLVVPRILIFAVLPMADRLVLRVSAALNMVC